MKVIIEDYKKAKSPLNPSGKVSLCEEETTVYYERKKIEVKINKLYLICCSTGTVFSNIEIESMNRARIEEVIAKKRLKNKKNEDE